MKIKFVFSNQFEQALSQNPVPFESARKALEGIEKQWNLWGRRIKEHLKRITHLEFTSKEITCYLNSKAAFSDPLSLKIEDSNYMLDNLVHELIHVLLTNNYKKIEEDIAAFHKKFQNEVFITRIHILIHAVHLLLAQEVFPERIKDIQEYSVNKDYRKAWEIVNNIGADKIVKDFFYK